MALLVTGQVTANGTAQTLDATGVRPVIWTLKATADNANPVEIGPAGFALGTGRILNPGDEITYDTRIMEGIRLELRPADIYVASTAGGVVSWDGYLG